jgi:Ca2+-binding EF-hand superfamily protein
MNRIIPLLFSLALASPALAFAANDGMAGEHCKQHSGLFKDADKDSDGTLDREEARAMQDKRFDEMDTNHDGKLSKEEMAACKQGKMGNARHNKGSKGFNKADKDHDGTLDRNEAKALPNVARHFDEIDTDKDGTLDRDEVHNHMKARSSK